MVVPTRAQPNRASDAAPPLGSPSAGLQINQGIEERHHGDVDTQRRDRACGIVNPPKLGRRRTSSVAADSGEPITVNIFDPGENAEARSFERVVVVGGNKRAGKGATRVVDAIDHPNRHAVQIETSERLQRIPRRPYVEANPPVAVTILTNRREEGARSRKPRI